MINPERKKLDVIISFLFGMFVSISICLIAFGYGNLLICIIYNIFIVIIFLFFLACFSLIDHSIKDSLTILLLTIGSLYVLYRRLKIENILKIKFIDNAIINILKINYINIFFNIMRNEWIKGITIAAVGGAIGTIIGGIFNGLIQNKIKARKDKKKK